MADPKLIIPEYKIDLLNKSKKIINTLKNIFEISEIKESTEKKKEKINTSKIKDNIDFKKSKKIKSIKKKIKTPRTLWVRRKKRA